MGALCWREGGWRHSLSARRGILSAWHGWRWLFRFHLEVPGGTRVCAKRGRARRDGSGADGAAQAWPFARTSPWGQEWWRNSKTRGSTPGGWSSAARAHHCRSQRARKDFETAGGDGSGCRRTGLRAARCDGERLLLQVERPKTRRSRLRRAAKKHWRQQSSSRHGTTRTRLDGRSRPMQLELF